MKKELLTISLLLSTITDIFATTNLNNKIEQYKGNHIYQLYNIYETKQSDIVMFGDSITYGANWNELFNKPIVNRGIGGDTTAGFLFRIEQVLKLHPKKVFIMGGINDIFQGYTIDEIFSNYKEILRKLKENNISVFVQSTLYTSDEKYNKSVTKLNELLIKYCDENKIIYIDLNKHLSKNELLINKYAYDGLHLRANAYEIWKNEIIKYIK